MTTTADALDWRAIDGWFSDDDARVYQQLVGQYIEGRMVEVGCWKGRSLASVLPVCRRLDYIYVGAVDTWEGSPGERDTYHAEARTRDISAVFESELRKRGLRDLVTVHIMDSLTAAKAHADASLDLVFIDGDHAAEAVCADVLAWIPKIRPGGVIAGHDAGWESVQRGLEAANIPWVLADSEGRSSIWKAIV